MRTEMDPTANCLSAADFLKLPVSKRGRIVVVEEEEMRDFVRKELEVGERPVVVWEPSFSETDRATFRGWLDDWSHKGFSDGVERAARRFVSGSDARPLAKFGTLVAVGETDALISARFGAQPRTVYQAHPATPGCYLPVDRFYEETVEERVHEAIRLMMSLGATRVEASYDREAFRAIGVDVEATVLGTSQKASFDARSEHSSHGAVAIDLPANRSLELPEGLRWLDDEPSWRTMAEARLKHHATQYHCFVAVHESHGINARLVTDLRAANLEVGGSFKRAIETQISFKADFRPGGAT